jgi:hypothetical protein
MQTIVYTICSVSHLGQAKTLCDSVIKHNPGYKCIIGLADEIGGRFDVDAFQPHRIIEGASINATDFQGMCRRYDVLELSCALKSFFADFIFRTFQPSALIFLDSDMMVFNSLQVLEEELRKSSLLITPHITKPFPLDDHRPRERDILKTGLYNAGFLGYSNAAEAMDFVSWWKARMVDQCYENPKEGLHADQNWLNFVPLFFPASKVLLHPGANMAYWNLHERLLTKKSGEFFVNDEWPLLFFHFSGFRLNDTASVSKHQDRWQIGDQECLGEVFKKYEEGLQVNEHTKWLTFSNAYNKEKFGGKLKKLFGS